MPYFFSPQNPDDQFPYDAYQLAQVLLLNTLIVFYPHFKDLLPLNTTGLSSNLPHLCVDHLHSKMAFFGWTEVGGGCYHWCP